VKDRAEAVRRSLCMVRSASICRCLILVEFRITEDVLGRGAYTSMTSAIDVVDVHVHFWEPSRSDRPHDPTGYHMPEVVTGEMMVSAMDEAGVHHAIQVTPSIMGYDNRYSTEMAQRYPDRFRVVARFNAAAPNPQVGLRTLLENTFIVGVRVIAPPFVLTDTTLSAFWAAAEELQACICVFAPNQARTLGAIAASHPTLTVVVDHFALANFDPVTSFDHWDDVMKLAHQPNVILKVSGLPEATDEPFPFPRARSYVKEAYATFGPDRLMWGSNYPPVSKWCSYRETLEYIQGAEFISEPDRVKILSTTAKRIFNLSW
jgi:L-fuconolactonase